MRISNWVSAKHQAMTKLPAFTITAAIIFFIVSFITFGNGSIDYREQTKRLDWSVTDATVSYVYEYFDAFHTHNGSGRTLYDVHYDYYVNEQVYSGVIEEQHEPKSLGDRFEIKYNPKNPEEHTRTLEISKSYLVSGSIFGALGLAMMVMTIILIKKVRNNKVTMEVKI